MSGERVVLAGDTEGTAARLVRVAARLADAGIPAHALIGGLAVMCRLAAVHRATHDVDTVTESSVPSAVELLVAEVGAPDPVNPDRAVLDGITIDVIATTPLTAADLVGLDAVARLFVVSHRWALETASATVLVAGTQSATIPVATPPALVAMKAAALLGGRTQAPSKRASDLYDVFRLVLAHDRTGGVADSLATAPFGLGHLVAGALRARVLDEPERAVRWLLAGGPEMAAVTREDLLDVIGPLVERLDA